MRSLGRPRASDSKRAIGAGVVLLAGAAVIVVLGLTRRDLPEVVLAIGATSVLAWLVEQNHRFIGSGCVFLGLGVGLTISEHIGHGDYRDQLLFAGIAAGLLLIRAFNVSATLAAALGLLSVAFFEFALQYLPTVVHADRLYQPFNDGWAFGVLIGVQACAVLLQAWSLLRRSASTPAVAGG